MRRSIPILWGPVIFLLILNLALVYGLNRARLYVIDTLGYVETTLDRLASEVIVYNIRVNQAVPVKADIPLNQRMEIPLNTVIPIDQVLRVPFQTASGQIEVEMPLNTDFPINMRVPVDFNETISVDTVVHLDTSVPVEIEVGRTSLVNYLTEAKLKVSRLRDFLSFGSETMVNEETSGPGPEAGGREGEETTQPAPQTLQASNQSASSSQRATDLEVQSKGTAAQSQDWCIHPYLPLEPGVTWIYNSLETAYTQRVNGVSDNQVIITTQQEGQELQTIDLACNQEGLHGVYLGDIRKLAGLGRLSFNNPRGPFLAQVEILENIGQPWTQEFEVTGSIDVYQGKETVVGKVSRGRAVAVYTPTGFETLETLLGPQQALRVEQQLEIELDIELNLDSQTGPARGIINLTNVYWFAKGIGPVKIHWQGGDIQQEFDSGDTSFKEQFSVPALAEEYLTAVCLVFSGERFECKSTQIGNVSGMTDPTELLKKTDDISKLLEKSVSSGNDNGQPELLRYVEAAANLGAKINDTAETFGEAALAYHNGDLSIDTFQDRFRSFAPQVKSLIQDVNHLSPPPQAEATHRQLTGGLGQCSQAVDLMNDWFDTRDNGTKEAATLLVASCINQVTSAGEDLQSLLTNTN
jgi:hypothetical protein